MALSLVTTRDNVRAVFQNLESGALSDNTLDLCIKLGLSRLSRDRANETNYSLSATGEKHNLSSLITDWVHDFSVVREVWAPIPTTSLDNTQALPKDQWRVQAIGATDYLFVSGGVNSGGVLLVYTVPWLLSGLDGAATTTIPGILESAFTWICASEVALAMAGKHAGLSDRSMPADFINMNNKADAYRRVAREYEKTYLAELNLSVDRPKAVAAVRSYRSKAADGTAYLTHRTNNLGRW